MNNIYKLFILSIFYLLLHSCNNRDRDFYKELNYEDLPFDVKDKFSEIYNKVPESIYELPPDEKCFDLDKACKCELRYKHTFMFSELVIPQKFIINTCDKRFEVPYSILQRIFVIKNDSLYYPYSSLGMLTSGKSRSENIRLDTVKFHVIEKRK